MRGLWAETNWRLDDGALLLPTGRRLKLSHIRQWQENLLAGHFDLTGKWSGWRVRQQFLIPPGGSLRRGRITEHALSHIVQMHDWACTTTTGASSRFFRDYRSGRSATRPTQRTG